MPYYKGQYLSTGYEMLGDMMSMKRNHEKALKLYLKQLSLFPKKHSIEGMEHFLIVKSKVASSYLALGEYEKCLSFLEDEIQRYRFVFTGVSNKPTILIGALSIVGLASRFSKAHDKAERYISEACRVAEENELTNEQEYLVNLLQLGWNDLEKNNHAAAIRTLLKAVGVGDEMKDELEDTAYLIIAKAHLELCKLYQKNDEESNTVHHINKALHIYHKNFKEEHVESLMECIDKEYQILAEQGKRNEGIAKLGSHYANIKQSERYGESCVKSIRLGILQLLESNLIVEQPEVIKFHEDLYMQISLFARLLLENQQATDAFKIWDYGIRSFLKQDDDHCMRKAADIYLDFANCLRMMGFKEEAVKNMELSCDIIAEKLGEDHILTETQRKRCEHMKK